MNETIVQHQGACSLMYDLIAQGKVVELPPDEEWPAPQPIPEYENLPAYESDLLLPPLREFVDNIAHRLRCPPEYAAVASLVMLGTVIGARVGIRPKQRDSWLVVGNLFGCVIGNPGDMKSPAIAEAFKPLDVLERAAEGTNRDAIRLYEAELELFKAQSDAVKKRLHEKGADRDQIKIDLLQLTPPVSPAQVRFRSNDATVEKLAKLQSENPAGILLARDELLGLLTSWERAGRESDRPYYLEAFNGTGSYMKDRVGGGTTRVERHCLSLFGGVQPDKLKEYMKRSLSEDNDGFVQRMQLMVYPDQAGTFQYVDEEPNFIARASVQKIVDRIVAGDFRQLAYDSNEEIPFFRFSTKVERDDSSAQGVFQEWYTRLQNETVRQESQPPLRAHWAKYSGLMPKLALLFHVLKVMTATAQDVHHVDLECAELAVRWCAFLAAHARKVYGLVLPQKQNIVKLLIDKVTEGKLIDGFTVKSVVKGGWRGLTNEPDVEAALVELVRLAYIKQATNLRGHQNRETIKYRINPSLRTDR